MAAKHGWKDIVQLLLDVGAEVNSRDRFGKTPLAYAVEWNHTAIVNVLKDNGGTE